MLLRRQVSTGQLLRTGLLIGELDQAALHNVHCALWVVYSVYNVCTSGCVMTVIRETGAVIIVVTNWQIGQDQTTHWIVHIIRPHIR